MKSAEIRKKFLKFFKDKDHMIVPSSSLIPADPTLLLTGAGMIQFKPIFLGKTSVDYTRAASAQKCVRTTDIENVGHTARHLTFFEMLGNFSFGDYYKKEICAWSWDFLINHLGLDKNKLWVTIFETDEEAFSIWKDGVKVDADRIVRLGEKDNFWAAGPTGPCGPCSEIIYDFGVERSCDKPNCGVGCDCDRFLELWNLVFMQYNRDDKGELHPLPKKNIDTGLGLERIASVLQDTKTNFEIDIVKPLIDRAAKLAGISYGQYIGVDTSLKIIADHVRAVSFLISDGVAPSNEGRGYILRRLIRRAIRHGRLIGIEDLFLIEMIEEVISIMGEAYPELKENQEMIVKIASKEEEGFNQTLKQGLLILNEVIEETRRKKSERLSGEIAFKLYDTFGFPLELTTEIAIESKLEVDKEKFDRLMEQQRKRARAEAVTSSGHAKIYIENIYPEVLSAVGATDFIGYDEIGAEAKILAIAVDGKLTNKASKGEEAEFFFAATPFYAEKGGQVGDTGSISANGSSAEVIATHAPLAELIAHKVLVGEGDFKKGQTVSIEVDDKRRKSISRNHTATHLLHWALRIILGKHVKQAGSLVEADRLRFDFNHHQPLTKDEVKNIERLINEKILQNHSVRAYTTTLENAKDIGAIAFFEDKYGEYVRVVEIGDYSKELCGGVHLGRTAEVGYFHITGATSIGANARRIEAVTGERFLENFYGSENTINEIADILGVKVDQVKKAALNTKEELLLQNKEIASLRKEKISGGGAIDTIKAARVEKEGVNFFVHELPDASKDELRQLADKLRSSEKRSIIVLASTAGENANLLVAGSNEAVDIGLKSNDWIKVLAPEIGGGGGGRDDLAQAGGNKPENIPNVITMSKKMFDDFIDKHKLK